MTETGPFNYNENVLPSAGDCSMQQIFKDKEDCEEKIVKCPKHVQFWKYCQTKDLFQKPR